MTSKRTKLPLEVEKEVLTQSRRRCCVCTGLRRDYRVKKGQIAHLDGNPNNNRPDNLAWLCFDDHDEFDGKTSQSKGLKQKELKEYRKELYERVKSPDAQFDKANICAIIEIDDPVIGVEFSGDILKRLVSSAPSFNLIGFEALITNRPEGESYLEIWLNHDWEQEHYAISSRTRFKRNASSVVGDVGPGESVILQGDVMQIGRRLVVSGKLLRPDQIEPYAEQSRKATLEDFIVNYSGNETRLTGIEFVLLAPENSIERGSSFIIYGRSRFENVLARNP